MPRSTDVSEAIRDVLRHSDGPYVFDTTDKVVWTAIPIPRRILQKELPYLMALAEFAGEGDSYDAVYQGQLDTRPVHSRLRRMWKKCLHAMPAIALIACSLIILTIGGTAVFIVRVATELPSFENKNARVMTPVLHAGEPLSIGITARRNSICPTIIERYILHENGSIAWNRIDYDPIINSIADWQEIILAIDLPSTFAPGIYSYRSDLITQCHSWAEVVVNPKMVHFPPPGERLVFQVIPR